MRVMDGGIRDEKNISRVRGGGKGVLLGYYQGGYKKDGEDT